MSAQANRPLHSRAIAQATALEDMRRHQRARDFAAGEKSGEARGFRKGMACAALLTCAGFITGLVLSVFVVPLLAWWLS